MFIELKKVTVELDGKSILQDINLQFKPGQITVIVGNSGSGLSVLLKTAAGLIAPSSGQVLYDGVPFGSLDEEARAQLQTRTGFVFQDIALWSNMSLAANLDLPLQAKFPLLDEASRQQKIEDALDGFDFSLDLNKRPVELSLGQQRLVAFLRAVIPQPEALLMDNPLSMMDYRWAQLLQRRLVELRKRGVTLVLGSHQGEVLVELADRLVIISQGRILAEGECAAIAGSTNPEIREILLSGSPKSL